MIRAYLKQQDNIFTNEHAIQIGILVIFVLSFFAFRYMPFLLMKFKKKDQDPFNNDSSY